MANTTFTGIVQRQPNKTRVRETVTVITQGVDAIVIQPVDFNVAAHSVGLLR